MASVTINISANIQAALNQIKQLAAALKGLNAAGTGGGGGGGAGGGFKAGAAGASNMTQQVGFLGKAVNGFTNNLKSAIGTVTSFNTVARVSASAARAVGTSMIFAGGAFRQLGVGINVTASLFQTFIPIVGALVEVLGPAALALVPVVAQLALMGGALAIAGLGLAAFAQQGIEFNQMMETTKISIATLVSQFNDLYDVNNRQIGAFKEVTDEQLKSMSANERDAYSKNRSIAIQEKLNASLGLAASAFRTLTVEAAQSPFTTLDLTKGFQAVEAVMGRYNLQLKDMAKLTVTLSRVASVAGVSAGGLASQFTLFLSGAGRITSPLARFAAQIGLSKQKMLEFRTELEKARNSPEKTAAIMSVLTDKLSAFDNAGQMIANSWSGIMSNMEESFQLFSGAVTEGLFNKVRDAFYKLVPVTDESGRQMYQLFDKNFNKLGQKAEGTLTELEKTTATKVTKVQGLLSQIFDYDPTGHLKTNIDSLTDIFSSALKPAAAVVEQLFNMIGGDLATALGVIGDYLKNFAVWLGENYLTVITTYTYVKQILEALGEIVITIFNLLGVSSDLNDNASSLLTILHLIDFSVQSVSAYLRLWAILILGVVEILSLPIQLVSTIIQLFIVVVGEVTKLIFGTKEVGATIDALVAGINSWIPGLNLSVALWEKIAGNASKAAESTKTQVERMKEIEALKDKAARREAVNSGVSSYTDNVYSGLPIEDRNSIISRSQGEASSPSALLRDWIDQSDKEVAANEQLKKQGKPVRPRRFELTPAQKADFQKSLAENRAEQVVNTFPKDYLVQTATEIAQKKIEDEKVKTVPGKNNTLDEKVKKQAKVVAELIPKLFKESNAVLVAELEFQKSLVERAYGLIVDKLTEASSVLQNKFEQHQISFIELSKQATVLSVAGIRAEMNERERLETLRKAEFDINLKNIKLEGQAETEQFNRDLKTAVENKKSAVEIQNLRNKHAAAQLKFALDSAKAIEANQEAEVKFITEKERAENKINQTILEANQKRIADLRKMADEAVSVFADLESKVEGAGTGQRSLALEIEARDKIKAALLDVGKLTELNNKYAKEGLAVEAKKNALIHEAGDTPLPLAKPVFQEIDAANKTLNTLKEQKDVTAQLKAEQNKVIDDKLRLLDIAKLQLQVDDNIKNIEVEKTKYTQDTEDIQKLVARGYISEAEGIELSATSARGLLDRSKDYLHTLKDIEAFYRENNNVLGAESIRKTREQLEDLVIVENKAAIELRNSYRSGFEGFFTDIQKNVHSIGEAFAKLGTSISDTFQKLIAKKLSDKLMVSLFGNGLKPGDQGYKKGLLGDIFPDLATGTGNTPSTPTPDDYVGQSKNIRKSTVEDVTNAGTASTIRDSQFALTLNEIVKAANQVLTPFEKSLVDITGRFADLNTVLSRGKDNITDLKSALSGAKEVGTVNAGFLSEGTESKLMKTFLQSLFGLESGGRGGRNVRSGANPNGAAEAFGLGQLQDETSQRWQQKYFHKVYSTDKLDANNGALIKQLLTKVYSDLLPKALELNKGDVDEAFRTLIASHQTGESGGTLSKAQLAKNRASGIGDKNILTADYVERIIQNIYKKLGVTNLNQLKEIPVPKTDVNKTDQPITITQTGQAPVKIEAQGDANVTTSGAPVLQRKAAPELGTDTPVPSTQGAISGGTIFDTISAQITKLTDGFYTVFSPVTFTLTAAVDKINAAFVAAAQGATANATSAIQSGVSAGAFAYGGYISGPGGPTADKIPAWLSNGEYVIRAAAVKALGMDKLHALNNADKTLPKFSLGGQIGNFLTKGYGALFMTMAAPQIFQKLFGKKSPFLASLFTLLLPGLMGAISKLFNSGTVLADSSHTSATPGAARGGLLSSKYGIPAFDTGGWASSDILRKVLGGTGSSPTFPKGSPLPSGTVPSGGGFFSGAIGGALKGGAISAGLQIGLALLSRLFRPRQPKYDPNRVRDPYGLNPDSLTFYKNPIVTGVRSLLQKPFANGGFVTSNNLLASMPRLKEGGTPNVDNLEGMLSQLNGGTSEQVNIHQKININTPDINSFRNNKAAIERDFARINQRGMKRRSPKY